MKKPAWPNDSFNSQIEYFEFCDLHKVYGGDAYKLKKELDKEIIPLPIIKPQ